MGKGVGGDGACAGGVDACRTDKQQPQMEGKNGRVGNGKEHTLLLQWLLNEQISSRTLTLVCLFIPQRVVPMMFAKHHR